MHQRCQVRTYVNFSSVMFPYFSSAAFQISGDAILCRSAPHSGRLTNVSFRGSPFADDPSKDVSSTPDTNDGSISWLNEERKNSERHEMPAARTSTAPFLDSQCGRLVSKPAIDGDFSLGPMAYRDARAVVLKSLPRCELESLYCFQSLSTPPPFLTRAFLRNPTSNAHWRCIFTSLDKAKRALRP